MGFWDSGWGDGMFDDTSGWSDIYGGGSDGDYSDLLGDVFGSGDSGGTDYSDLAKDVFGAGDGTAGSGGSSGGSSWLQALLGGGSGSGSGGGNIFGALLSGLSGAAGSWMDSKNAEKAMKMKGEQDRKTLSFGSDLEDYFKQKDKARKRVALDTYGQFSQIKKYAPQYTNTPPVEVPAKPNAGSY